MDFGAGSFPAWANDADNDDVDVVDGDDGVGDCKYLLLVECLVAKRGHELHPGALAKSRIKL